MDFHILVLERKSRELKKRERKTKCVLEFEREFECDSFVRKLIREHHEVREIFLYATRGVAFLFVELEFFRRPDRRLSSDSGEVKLFPAKDNPTRKVDWTRRTRAEDHRRSYLPFLSFQSRGRWFFP